MVCGDGRGETHSIDTADYPAPYRRARLPVNFARWRPPYHNYVSGFVFGYSSYVRRTKSVYRPNFVDIPQSTAELLLLPVAENSLQIRIILPVWIFSYAGSSLCHSASAHQISSESDRLHQSYDVISDFQHGWRQEWYISSRVMLDHPRRAIEALGMVL